MSRTPGGVQKVFVQKMFALISRPLLAGVTRALRARNPLERRFLVTRGPRVKKKLLRKSRKNESKTTFFLGGVLRGNTIRATGLRGSEREICL